MPEDTPILPLDVLAAAVGGKAAAIRSITTLDPAGGRGDKLFPPTYLKSRQAETKYAFEKRRIGEREVSVVLLDSVASQANRFEEALQEAWDREDVTFPLVRVDFSGERDLEDFGHLSALQAPHRIADALLRDSTLDGVPFRRSKVGEAFGAARVNHATAMYRYCPTALLFGVWDSTGPLGGLGAKFQRLLVSEIVGIDALQGVKVGSRLDPAGIQKAAGPVFLRKDQPTEWTLDPSEAELDKKGKPIPFSRKGVEGKDKGTPAAINHSNVPPTIDEEAGGVTIDHALQTTVLSLIALRRLRFREDLSGAELPKATRAAAEDAARTVLAALGLAAVALQREQGYDLRSRSILVPRGPLVLEVLDVDGGEPARYRLSREGALGLLRDAHRHAETLGLAWQERAIDLKPTPQLAELIRKSRQLAAQGLIDADEGEE